MPTIHRESHTDHLTMTQIAWVLAALEGRDGFFIETLTMPVEIGSTINALYGPACGDPPILDAETYEDVRPPRKHLSRLKIDSPKRKTQQITAICGPHDGQPCVVYTIYGGPLAPKEPTDPTLQEKDREESIKFWSQHALASR